MSIVTDNCEGFLFLTPLCDQCGEEIERVKDGSALFSPTDDEGFSVFTTCGGRCAEDIRAALKRFVDMPLPAFLIHLAVEDFLDQENEELLQRELRLVRVRKAKNDPG